MIDNSELWTGLVAKSQARAVAAHFFKTTPGSLTSKFDFDRVEGMLLGLAIGDALGNTSESKTPSHRKEIYGEIRDYLPNHYANNLPKGLPSDDTQMAFWTLEVLLQDGGLIPDDLANRFASSVFLGSAARLKISFAITKMLNFPGIQREKGRQGMGR